MNAVACLTPGEIRALIHWHAERREEAALMCDRERYEASRARIAELERMLPERQYEAVPA